MNILAIESSGRLGSAALLQANEGRVTLIAERETPADQRTARSLLPMMQHLLREQGWRPAAIDLVCVTTGPGSFTGLRIGVVTAKTFAYATGAKLVGVHTLAAMVAGIETDAPRLWTILDAQRQELFVASFTAGQPLAEPHDPPTEILTLPQWLARLAPGDAVAGPPLEKLRDRLPPGVTPIDPSHWQPRAAAVGQLGAQLFARGQQSSPLELIPNYYRKSAAEEKAGPV